MKKFNQLEAYWLKKGLELVETEACKEIDAIVAEGKNPLMTCGFISAAIEELRIKITEMTKKK